MHKLTDLGKLFFCVLALVAFGFECAHANVSIQKGEGSAGLDAYFPLDKSDELSLSITGCKKKGEKLAFGVGLFVGEKKRISRELEKLRDRELNARTNLFLCINELCEERTWEFLASGFGDAFFADLSIDRKHDQIRVVRVVIPNERKKYEYRGDVDSVLKKICR